MDVAGYDDLSRAQGVTRWTLDVPVADLEEQLRADGRQVVLLDGTDVEDKAGFLIVCELAFALPDWFGRNWDALEESLADLDISDGIVVLWSGWELFAESEPDEYATALDIFSDAARRYAADDTSFVVLLLGEEDLEDGTSEGPDEADDDLVDEVLEVESEPELELAPEEYDLGPVRPEDEDPTPG